MDGKTKVRFSLTGSCESIEGFWPPYFLNVIKFYRYEPQGNKMAPGGGSLEIPHGDNLFAVVQGSQALRNKLVDLLKPYEWMPVLKRHPQCTIEIQKHSGGLAFNLPWSMVSDTLQRMLFYSAAILSNENKTIVLEEPEAHAFPYYVKHLGEYIALHSNNQFFIATHNPYFLTALVEKVRKEDLAVFAVYYRHQETKAKVLSESQLQQLMEQDPFLGLENILGD